MEKRHSIWLQYAVAYVLVLAVPFFAFSLYFTQYVSRAAQMERQTEMRRTLHKIQADFDQKVAQMFSISIQLGAIRDFRTASLQKFSMETRMNIERTLASYCSTTMFFSDIVYYNRTKPDLVFTTQGTYNTPYYRLFADDGKWLSLDQLGPAWLSRGWIPSSEMASRRVALGEALLFSEQLEGVNDGYLLFEVRESAMRNELLASLSENSEVLIYSGGTRLYPFHAREAVPYESISLSETPVAMEDGRFQYTSLSEGTGLLYVYITEESDVTMAVQMVFQGFLLLTVLVSLLCCAAIIMISRRHAMPIEKLITLAGDIDSGSAKGLARVHSAMRHLQSRSQELDETRRQVMREHVLIRLIRGKYKNDEEAEYNLGRLDMSFRYPEHVIVLLLREPGQEDRDSEARIMSLLMRRHSVYGFSYAERSVYVMMMDLQEGGRRALVEEIEAMLAAPELADAHVRFTVGCAFEGYVQARDSYMQALFAGSRETAAPVTLFEHNDPQELFYPHEELRALSDALACKDRNRTAFLYDVLLMLVARNNDIYVFTMSLLSEMIQLYWQALNASARMEGDATLSYAAWARGENIACVEDMLECLKRLHERALRQMAENDLMQGEETEMLGIAAYITACEDLKNLTVGDVAEYFGMNISSLSHKFKERMGCNVSDYILTRKMSHACMLLRTSEDTVTEIAEKIGYSQYTSFVRQFKRQKGMTPTAYREEWRRSGVE